MKLPNIKLQLNKLAPLKGPAKRLALLTAGAVFILQAPQMQRNWLRNKAGTQTYMITDESGKRGGTGFSVKAPSGKVYTLTNAHVCELANDKNQVFASSAIMRQIPLQVIEQSKNTDLCLLTEVNGTPGLSVADSVRVGEEINIVGHPKLMPITLSRGEIIGYKDVIVGVEEGPCEKEEGMYKTEATLIGPICTERLRAVLTSAPSFGGNSGSAVLNWYGEVIGVLFASDNEVNWGILIKLKDINEFLKAY